MFNIELFAKCFKCDPPQPSSQPRSLSLSICKEDVCQRFQRQKIRSTPTPALCEVLSCSNHSTVSPTAKKNPHPSINHHNWTAGPPLEGRVRIRATLINFGLKDAPGQCPVTGKWNGGNGTKEIRDCCASLLLKETCLHHKIQDEAIAIDRKPCTETTECRTTARWGEVDNEKEKNHKLILLCYPVLYNDK